MRPMIPLAAGLAVAMAIATPARADDAPAPAAGVTGHSANAHPSETPARGAVSAPSAARHAIYVEALGKGGLWGLGYAYQLRPRLALGAVASFTVIDGQRITSFSPSATVYPLGGGRHRWFVDLGPQIVHVATPSPVPEWMGTSSTGLGAQLATGYEYRRGVLLRAFAMVVTGGDGGAPWLGADAGWTF